MDSPSKPLIYRQSLAAPVSVVGGGVSLLWLIPKFRTWYAVIIIAYVAVMSLVECRRAIILTDSKLIYRPAYGRTLQIDLRRIESVTKCNVSVPSLAIFRPRLSKGLCFAMQDGTEQKIPLDFPHSRGISERFLRIR